MYITTNKLADVQLDGWEMIYDCQFHPDRHDCIGFSSIDGDIKMLEFKDATNEVFTLAGYHKGNPIRKIRFRNNFMFTAGRSIKITDVETQKLVRKISNGRTKIYSLLVADDYLVCLGDDDGSFKVWDYRTERPVHMCVRECENYISDLDIDSESRLVVASSGEGTLSAFNIRARKMEYPQSELFDSGFQCVRFLEDKKKVAVGAEDGVINIFNKNEWGNISDRFPVKQNNIGISSIDCMEVMDDETNCLVMGTSDGSIEAISLFPHRSLTKFSQNEQSIESVDVNQITQKIVAVSGNRIQLFSYQIDRSENKNPDLHTPGPSGFFSGLATN